MYVILRNKSLTPSGKPIKSDKANKNKPDTREIESFLECRDKYCEAQARVRQGSARDGSQGKRPQSLNPSLELTLKLVATTHPPPNV